MEFFCDTRIFSGNGALEQLKQLHIRNLLLVADPYFGKTAWPEKIRTLAGAQTCQVFDKVTPDPSVELVAEGVAVLKKAEPDAVVALGGGSAMDCAKAMLFFAGSDARLIAVPTTSGSGSEVTDFAILTHNGVKHPLVDGRLRPYAAILDSQLLESLPPKLIADSGFDVIAHALEAWVATGSDRFTDALAKDAFCGVLEALPDSYRGNCQVRLDIHCRATMAGIAFTRAGLGLCHAAAHALGGEFHIPHGRLNGILLPAVVSCNAQAAPKYACLARLAGLSGGGEIMAVRSLKNALCRLRRELDMPGSLWETGIQPGQVESAMERLVTAVLSDPCCQTNPQPVTEQMVRQLLWEVMGRG